jgi:beta-1,4-mannosyl-glycoprotein beta-1,4-N-acetylglucosaminyltransferase
MRVFDCILFNQEHDMLECRLTEIGDVVDKVIVVESTTTFMGQPKPHGIDLDRFYKWRDKIHYETFDEKHHQHGWATEHAQRNHLFVALQQFSPEAEDIVTVADCDEIWNPADIDTLKEEWHGYIMKRLVMSAYWRFTDEHHDGCRTVWSTRWWCATHALKS